MSSFNPQEHELTAHYVKELSIRKVYDRFNELKKTHKALCVHISVNEIVNVPKSNDPLGYRDYVSRKFKEEHKMEVTRFSHDYNSGEPGLVFLNSSWNITLPGLEVWGLVGVNLKEVSNG